MFLFKIPYLFLFDTKKLMKPYYLVAVISQRKNSVMGGRNSQEFIEI